MSPPLYQAELRAHAGGECNQRTVRPASRDPSATYLAIEGWSKSPRRPFGSWPRTSFKWAAGSASASTRATYCTRCAASAGGTLNFAASSS